MCVPSTGKNNSRAENPRQSITEFSRKGVKTVAGINVRIAHPQIAKAIEEEIMHAFAFLPRH